MTLTGRLRFAGARAGLAASLRVAGVVGRVPHARRLQRWVHRVGHRFVRRYLEWFLAELLGAPTGWAAPVTERPPTTRVWVCWWQGEDAAPPVVRACLRQLRAVLGADLEVITEANHAQHCDLDASIVDAHRDGRLSHAHLSDVLRMAVLSQRGGTWLDATVYVTSPVEASFFDAPLVTLQHPAGSGRFVSDRRWTLFLFGGRDTSQVAEFVHRASVAYWDAHTTAIDYFLTDYLLDVAVRHDIGRFAALVSSLEHATSPDVYALRPLMGLPVDRCGPELSTLLSEPAFYKLDWKSSDSSGEVGSPTVADRLVRTGALPVEEGRP